MALLSSFFFLLGKNRPLTRTYPREEGPLWRRGAGSAVPPADTRWCWTDTGFMDFRETCSWKTSSTSTSRSPAGKSGSERQASWLLCLLSAQRVDALRVCSLKGFPLPVLPDDIGVLTEERRKLVSLFQCHQRQSCWKRCPASHSLALPSA